MYKEKPIIGLDTETYTGLPYTIQMWSRKKASFLVVNQENVFLKFVEALYDFPSGSSVFVHNLEFDLPVLFYPYLHCFKDTEFELNGGGFHARILCGKIYHASLKIREKTYELIDTMAFFPVSLAKLAKLFDLTPKMKKPRKLGEVRYKGKEWESFKEYAMNDAQIACELGEKIDAFHKEMNVYQTISAPQLSAKIFRSKFIPVGYTIPACEEDCDRASVLSYHGGKNGMYCEPGVYRNVSIYDINSAYPFAFTKLPNFLEGTYQWIKKPIKRTPPYTPGVYCISGVSESRTYNLLRNHNFEPVYGPFENIWVTSYELNVIVRYGFVTGLKLHEAFCLEEGPIDNNPLKDFAEEFYKKKSESKGEIREFYKIILNSLYGKFIQNVGNADMSMEVTKDDVVLKPVHFMAGGLWNPFIATLITGYVRAYLTELEIKYHSLHSSTDSIITRKKAKTSKTLGALSLKGSGNCLLVRPKLYVIWDRRCNVIAFALHGFHGNLSQFLNLVRSGKRTYSHRRMIKVKESFRQKKAPFVMETMFKRVNLPLEGPISIPKLKYTVNGRTFTV